MCIRLGRSRGCSDCEGRENVWMYNFTFDSIVSSFIFVAHIIDANLMIGVLDENCIEPN